MSQENVRSFTDAQLLEKMVSNQPVDSLATYLDEGLNRFLHQPKILERFLDSLFYQVDPSIARKNMAVLSSVISKPLYVGKSLSSGNMQDMYATVCGEVTPGFTWEHEALSSQYFIAASAFSAEQKMSALSASELAAREGLHSRSLLLGLGLSILASQHRPDEFVELIHLYNEGAQYSLRSLDQVVFCADYGRHDLWSVFDRDAVPVGVTENMLYSPEVFVKLETIL